MPQRKGLDKAVRTALLFFHGRDIPIEDILDRLELSVRDQFRASKTQTYRSMKDFVDQISIKGGLAKLMSDEMTGHSDENEDVALANTYIDHAVTLSVAFGWYMSFKYTMDCRYSNFYNYLAELKSCGSPLRLWLKNYIS